MAKILSPKCKLCRREGKKLYLKGERCFSTKCAIVKRNYPPGIQGPKGSPRLTQYGIQLREKQKAKRVYNLFEKQFKNYFDAATKKKGDTAKIFVETLERRLDNVIFRSGIAVSRPLARQLVSHNSFQVNGRKMNIPSYIVQVGDVITIKKPTKKVFTELSKKLSKFEAPSWISVDSKKLEAKITSTPNYEELTPEFDPALITEFYSR